MSLSAYGYRRIGAELRHRGIVVNSKKIRRLLREHDLQPRRRRRFVPTTDSNHDGPRITTPGRRSKTPRDPVHRQERAPDRGQIWKPIDTRPSAEIDARAVV